MTTPNKFFVLLLLMVFMNDAFGSNEVSLEDVIKQILKINPPEGPVGTFREEQQPPKHMLELYRRFTSGRRASGETVRSITPIKDADPPNTVVFNVSHIGGDEEVRLAQLVLRRRRLQRHPHPLHRKLLAPPCRVRVFQVVRAPTGAILTTATRSRTLPLASIPVPQVSRGGWHSLDITSAVRELLVSSPEGSTNLLLGVRFEAPRSRTISPLHFLDQKDNTSSFLMLFSDESPDNELSSNDDNDNQNTNIKRPLISREHIEIIAQHIKNLEHNPDSNSNKAQLDLDQLDSNHIPDDRKMDKHGHKKGVKQRHHLHHSRVYLNPEDNPRRHKNKNGEENPDEVISANRVKKFRKHRKLFDEFNLKYDDERESENRAKIKSNLIEELLENSETRRVIRSVDLSDIKTHKRRSIYDNELPYDKLHFIDVSKSLTTTDVPEMVTEFSPREEDDDRNLIPYPPGTERKKKRRGRRGKKKNHRSKTTKFPDEWNKNDRDHHRQLYGPPKTGNSSANNHTCARRHLVVNFKDLGWSNWIIEPKLFSAHYCAGSCSFPVPENVPVTNHAVIQGLVHERGLHKGVPAPCCVPHSMSPLTILYLEDDNHVILKNYRSMTVETCGCR